ncbi:hypothetical protein BRYFOR_05753 [Marvinbryantia formatexigens DSM 14469]|uniref:Uncharacterized protein n=1 Tax=Marvinbryantia formatexigens DSM 14469 TaxID=478749 RepID=C6LAV9_9FIRM|nr:hypothetical protein BRYFOR_05753 [Marvinbryantia formatexigens DSM 14469]
MLSFFHFFARKYFPFCPRTLPVTYERLLPETAIKQLFPPTQSLAGTFLFINVFILDIFTNI